MALVAVTGDFAAAQNTAVHPLIESSMAPGVIGRKLLKSGEIKPTTFQPVKIVTPNEAIVSTAIGNGFNEESWQPVLGLLVGRAYRFKVSYVTETEQHTVYPTIELIDNLDPPDGRAGEFPIPVEFTAEEIKLASAGNMVTRVVYVEDPKMSLPSIYRRGKAQPYFETDPGTDPLAVADTLGRPVAIVRIGSRAPDKFGPTGDFMFQSPPLNRYVRPTGDFAFEDRSRGIPADRHYIERASHHETIRRAANLSPASLPKPMKTIPVRNARPKRQNEKRSTWNR